MIIFYDHIHPTKAKSVQHQLKTQKLKLDYAIIHLKLQLSIRNDFVAICILHIVSTLNLSLPTSKPTSTSFNVAPIDHSINWSTLTSAVLSLVDSFH